MVRSPQTGTEYLSVALALHDTFSISAALNKFNRVIILGGPGAGKTTILEHLVALYALKTRRQGRKNRVLPIYVPLRKCVLDGRPLTEELTDPKTGLLLPEVLKKYPRGFFESRLERHSCLLLFDGMDEVLDDRLHVAAARLIETCAVLYPTSRIVVTSRIAGWRGLLRSNFSKFAIRDLSAKEIGRLVQQWYLAVLLDKAKAQVVIFSEQIRAGVVQQSAEIAARVTEIITSSPRLQEIANTPLILSLICLVYYVRHDLPEKRAQLYDECSRVLLAEWDETDKQLTDVALYYAQKRAILQKIAFHLFRNAAAELSGEDLSTQVSEFLEEAGISLQSDRVWRHIYERSGLIVEKSLNSFGFAHLTFQEYFTALSLLEMHDGLSVLMQALQTRPVREIALLYAGASKTADPLLKQLVGGYRLSRQRQDLMTAGLAISESRAVSLELKSEITSLLNQEFDSTNDANVLLELQSVLSRLGVVREIIRTFLDYQVFDELGRGGNGTVYRAFDRSFNREVALKVYNSGLGTQLQTFSRDVEQLKTIRHPSLVSIYDVGKTGDQLFVTMELVRGSALDHVYEQQRLRFEAGDSSAQGERATKDENARDTRLFLGTDQYYRWLRAILQDISSGISELHRHSLIHGDVKPSNVLVTADEGSARAQVSDFCLDRIAGRGTSDRTVTRPVMFSLKYAAPELIYNGQDGRLSAAVDVFSFALLAGEMILLEDSAEWRAVPFPFSYSPIRHLDTNRLGNCNAFREVKASGIRAILIAATSENPRKRPASITELWEEIDARLNLI